MAEEIKNYTQNRELSWLAFNDRVLEEARDPQVPLLERLRFLSIYTSNLDEFFMIRVGSLYDIAALGNQAVDPRTGLTAEEQLQKIYQKVHPMYRKQDETYRQLRRELNSKDIRELDWTDCNSMERAFLQSYFMEQVFPILSPQIVDSSHPFPHLLNKELYVVAQLNRKKRDLIGIVPIPDSLPNLVFFPGENLQFIRIESVILHCLDMIFTQDTISGQNCICVTRNADISPDDELFDVEDDYRRYMKKLLHQRKRMAIVRMESRYPLEEKLENQLLSRCQIVPEQIFVTRTPMRMDYVDDLIAHIPETERAGLSYPPYTPQRTIPQETSMLKLVQSQDVLLSYPYESMEPFLQLLREASVNPDVLSIKITIYRLARNARLVDYLCAAAENGKEVVVQIELRARFDEQNNIDWSERLENAGCRVLYGFETYKVHAKICLITMRGKHGLKYITQIGTGNYNEKTAKLYTDFSFMTADPGIAADAVDFFHNMALGNLHGAYQQLLVSPANLKQTFLDLIDEEIRKGSQGRILIKCNSITDCDLLRALSRASQAGVQVQMIVRGICCLLPGIPGYTDNIQVTSIVGRYLEHARVYAFGQGTEKKVYIGSADWMTRNTERRVEVIAPIHNPALKEEILDYIQLQLEDTVKARVLQSDGTYRKKEDGTLPKQCAQEIFMERARKKALHGTAAAIKPIPPKKDFWNHFRQFLGMNV